MKIFLYLLIPVLMSFRLFAEAPMVDLEEILIDRTKVKKVTYVLASSKGIGQSMFGHAYLRFSYGDKYSVFDPTIEFVADIEAGQIDILRGMGIGQNYNVAIKPISYKYVYNENAVLADRDLTSYELKITKDQKDQIVDKINDLIVFGSESKYSFFLTNCASLVSDSLNISLEEDKQIYGLSVITPSLLPYALKREKLLKSVFKDLRATKKKQELFDKYFPKDAVTKNQRNRIRVGMNHIRPVRKFTYLQLASLGRDESIKPKNRRKTVLLGKKSLFLEILSLQKELFPYFRKDAKKVSFLEIIGPRLKFDTGKQVYLEEATFENKGENVYIRYKTNFLKYKQRIDQVKYKEGSYRIKNKIIGHKLFKELTPERLFSRDIIVLHRIGKDGFRKHLISQFVFTADDLKETSNDKLAFSLDTDLLSVGNGHDGKAMCFSIAEMQKMLLERAIFAPKAAALSEDENKKLIQDLYRGKFIVVPGYKNIASFIKSFDQSWLANLIYKRHITKYSFYENAKRWFSDVQFEKKEDINTIKGLIKLGHYPIINFETRRINGLRIGHSVIVLEVEEDDEYYNLKVHDPNYQIIRQKIMDTVKGSSKLQELEPKILDAYISIQTDSQIEFKISKKTMALETKLYGVTKAQMFKFSVDYNDLFIKITKGQGPQDISLRKRLIDYVIPKTGRHSFYPHELLK